LKRLAKKQAKEAGMQACPSCGPMVPTERINQAVLKKTT
jgi:ribosomal protein L32